MGELQRLSRKARAKRSRLQPVLEQHIGGPGTVTSDGTVIRVAKDHILREYVLGYPGLWRFYEPAIQKNGCWRIQRRGSGTIRLEGIFSVDAAKRLYAQWELDPDGFTAEWDRKQALRGLKLGDLLREYLNTRVAGERRMVEMVRVLNGFVARQSGRLRDVTRQSVEAWMSDALPGLAPQSQASYYATVRSFVLWLVDTGRLPADPTRAIRPPRGESQNVDRCRIVPEGDIVRVLREIQAEWAKHALVVLWACGLRKGELLRYKVDGLTNELVVASLKGGPTRRVPMADAAVHVAALRLLEEKPSVRSINNLGNILDRAIEKAGVDRFTPHALRHSRITIWLQLDGCGLWDVSRWAGHANVNQTMEYVGEAVRSVVLPKATGLASALY